MLTWTQNGAAVEAFGCRGHYLILSHPDMLGVVLRGTGHDGLPMLCLPPTGRQCVDVDQAKGLAERIEWVRTTEPQASGA